MVTPEIQNIHVHGIWLTEDRYLHCICRAWYISCSAGCIATVHPSRHVACQHDDDDDGGGAPGDAAGAGRHDCDRGMA